MDGRALEENKSAALEVIKEAVSEPEGTFALYDGDAAGRVLLHMLWTVGGGRVHVPVIAIQFEPMSGEAFRFAEKLRRIYSLDISFERYHSKPDGSGYTEEERKEKVSSSLSKRGVKKVLSSCTKPLEEASQPSIGAYTEYRPLSGFSVEDIEGYIAKYRLPLCSLDKGDSGTTRPDTGGRAESPEDKELAEKLRKLGYM